MLLHSIKCTNTCTRDSVSMQARSAGWETYLNCWCSLELRILEENLSASFSKLREYSSSISALRRKNSCRSCSSWMRDSDCCSKHLNCSTSWLRISVHQNTKEKWHEQTFYTQNIYFKAIPTQFHRLCSVNDWICSFRQRFMKTETFVEKKVK